MFEHGEFRPLWPVIFLQSALGLLCVLNMGLALADSPTVPTIRCTVTSAQQAKSLADVLYEQREYERAGDCYEAAGDASRAQLAYLKAAGPNSESAARGLRESSCGGELALLRRLRSAPAADGTGRCGRGGPR